MMNHYAHSEGLPSVPAGHLGADDTCSICQERVQTGERVFRLICRHMYHATSWHNLTINSTDRGLAGVADPECPNCRGRGQLIAIWDYMDQALVTQWAGGEQLTNDFNSQSSATLQLTAPPAVTQQIETPRSLHTYYHWGTPMSGRTPTGSGREQGHVAMPASSNDAQD